MILIPDNVSCNFEFRLSIASCLFFPERFNLFAYFLTVIIKIGATTRTPKVKSKSVQKAIIKQTITLITSGIILNISSIIEFILPGSVITRVIRSPIFFPAKYSISKVCILL